MKKIHKEDTQKTISTIFVLDFELPFWFYHKQEKLLPFSAKAKFSKPLSPQLSWEILRKTCLLLVVQQHYGTAVTSIAKRQLMTATRIWYVSSGTQM